MSEKPLHPLELQAKELSKAILHGAQMYTEYLNDTEHKPPFGRELTGEEQYKRYERMTPEDWTAERESKGDGHTLLHYAKQERYRIDNDLPIVIPPPPKPPEPEPQPGPQQPPAPQGGMPPNA